MTPGTWAVITAALALLATVYAVFQLADRAVLLPGASLGDSQVLDLGKSGTFRRAFVDPAGKTVVLEEQPSAIVSVILGGDEMLARLVDPERVSSVTYLADDPGISNVSGIYPPSIRRNYGDVEEVIAAQPDLVLLAAYTNAVTASMLLDAGIALLRFTRFDSHDDIRSNVRTLALAVGEEGRGEAWLAEMDERIDAVRNRVAGRERPRVLFYGMSGSTAGPGSLMHETITLAGGKNVIAETGLGSLPRISPELAVSLQPEIVLLNGWSGADGASASDILLKNPAWEGVPAVRSGRVYSIEGAWLTSISPHRVRGVEEVARLLHPGAFPASVVKR